MSAAPENGPEPGWVADVIAFWLSETPPEARFKRDPVLDETIRARFGALCQSLLESPPSPRGLTARHALAAIIVLDQFPRNLYRGNPKAFAGDDAARRLAAYCVDHGLDRELATEARLFVYLPFEHSEDRADQDRSVALIGTLGDAKLDDYACRHRDIVARFGRFPHRNEALGRSPTAEELEFLKEPGSSF